MNSQVVAKELEKRGYKIKAKQGKYDLYTAIKAKKYKINWYGKDTTRITITGVWNSHSKRWISVPTYRKHALKQRWYTSDPTVSLYSNSIKEAIQTLENSTSKIVEFPINLDINRKKTTISDKTNLYPPKKFSDAKDRYEFSPQKNKWDNASLKVVYPCEIDFIGFMQIVQTQKTIKITNKGIENPDADPWILLELKYAEYCNYGKHRGHKRYVLIKKDDYYMLNKNGSTYTFPEKEIDFTLCLEEKKMIQKLIEHIIF